MATYTVTSYVHTGYSAYGKPFEMKISDDDDTADWFGKDTGEKEVAEIDGETHAISGSGVYKITFENSDGEIATEDVEPDRVYRRRFISYSAARVTVFRLA